LLYAFTD